ncbi:MAG: molecular chaperone HscC [Thalassolituus sp.]
MAFIGIDLGTTNSLAAVWLGDDVSLVPNALGEFLTPSVVSVTDDQTVLVGRTAKERLVSHPTSTTARFKRLMGTSSTITLNGKEFTPEELSALVLRQLKADAERFLGEPVTEAIISVPAYFNDNQRNATRIAAKLAGLKVERLINEPTAAAIAYGVREDSSEMNFIVVDLGGGTFDVSVMEKFDDLLEVQASAGDSELGGEDFTQALVEYILQQNALSWQVLSLQERGRIYRQVDQLKALLSEKESAEFAFTVNEREYTAQVNQAELAGVWGNLLKRLTLPVERALRDADLTHTDISHVFMVGGATRMPQVQQLMTRVLRRFPACHINPDHVVAMGAAIQAALKQKNKALGDVVLTDVMPFSLGVGCSNEDGQGGYLDDVHSIIIQRNTTIPVSRASHYVTLRDYQDTIHFTVYQGEHRLAQQNIKLGELAVSVPKARAGEEPVEVRFTYDINGLLEVNAKVLSTGVTETVVIQNSENRLSEEEIAEALARLSELKIPPAEQAANKALMARGERLFIEHLGQVRRTIGDEIQLFEQALATQDARVAEKAAREFEAFLNKFEIVL